jgi:ribonuclease VapC
MMVDTSAVVAIIRAEPEAEKFANVLESAKRSQMVAPNYLELCMVLLGNKEPSALRKIKFTLEELGLAIIPFTLEMAEVAVAAFEAYGKGRHPKANLNFGDCIAYAASKVEGLPLLFKGNDFRQTDVDCAI